MSEYLNKIGLVKYNNTTYKPVGQTQYYQVRDPGLVSSDPRANFFNYPWKSDGHWSYNNYGQGWYYNGKDEIAYTVSIPDVELSCFNPAFTSDIDQIVPSGYVYNVIPMHSLLLSNISSNLIKNDRLIDRRFYNPTPLYIFKPFNSDEVFEIKWNNDYRAYGNIEDPLTYTYILLSGGQQIKLELNWCPESGAPAAQTLYTPWPGVASYPEKNCPLYRDENDNIYLCYQSTSDDNIQRFYYIKDSTEASGWRYENLSDQDIAKLKPYISSTNSLQTSALVSGYWTDMNITEPISGIIQSYPFIEEGSINDLYSNQIQFQLKSPNISGLDVIEYFYKQVGNDWVYDGQMTFAANKNIISEQSSVWINEIDSQHPCLVWKRKDEIYVSQSFNNITYYYKQQKNEETNTISWIECGTKVQHLLPVPSTILFHPQDNPLLQDKECPIWISNNTFYTSYTINDLTLNLTEGTFNNIPGTDYITGICTTRMLFVDAQQQDKKQYVYMRGLFRGNIEVQNGILQNEVVPPSTIIKKVKIKNIQGTLKNASELPEEIKYGLNYYYAWGWLYGVDNITYKNVWYKNEISGTLKASIDDYENQTYNYTGVLSVPVITNDGNEDITNIITGKFSKDEKESIITGYLEGTIQPFSIKMKGFASGYYSIPDNLTLKPIQLSSVLFNKSIIGDNLRQILDIKYANTLGRKGLTYFFNLETSD